MKVLISKPYFSVDSVGNIYWTDTGTCLSQSKDKDGYLRCTYRARDRSHHTTVHRAVAEMYVTNPRPDKYNVVNHKDSDRTNNSPDNLQWTDAKGNRQHSHVTGTHSVHGVKHSQCKSEEKTIHSICQQIALGLRPIDIAHNHDLPPYRIQNIKRGLAWREISCDYSFTVPRKDTISKATMEWLVSQTQDGLSVSEIVQMCTRFSDKDIGRITELLLMWKCND